MTKGKAAPQQSSAGAAVVGSASPPTNANTKISMSELFRAMLAGFGQQPTDQAKTDFYDILKRYIIQETANYSISDQYNVLVIFDNTTMTKADADLLYRAMNGFKDQSKPLMLVLLSTGGFPGSAYLIGKLCQEFCNGKFIVSIPRYAKSAATLLACAAHEIHMGHLSELGPIDPQIDGMPALGLKNAIDHIAELVSKTPSSAEMFARYLNLSIQPVQIGHYERVAESAAQYAERLLTPNESNLPNSAADIANKLVYGYKDHGFVIDKTEALAIFGSKALKTDTEEYRLGNGIYSILTEVERMADFFGYSFYLVGSLSSNPRLHERKRK